jgi:hypothetical protein
MPTSYRTKLMNLFVREHDNVFAPSTGGQPQSSERVLIGELVLDGVAEHRAQRRNRRAISIRPASASVRVNERKVRSA